MTKIVQIRDVPDAVHAGLARMAEQAGVSLNRFVLSELQRVVRRGRNAERLRRAATRRGRASSAQVLDAVRADREERR